MKRFVVLLALFILTGCMNKEKSVDFVFDDTGLVISSKNDCVCIDSYRTKEEADILVLTRYPENVADLEAFLQEAEVDKLYLPPAVDPVRYDNVLLAAADSEVQVFALQGDTQISEGAITLQLHPAGTVPDGSPTLWVKVRCKDKTAVYLAENEANLQEIIKNTANTCDILKMPGGAYSEDLQSITRLLTPRQVVFCSGMENMPDNRLLAALEETGCDVYKTAGKTAVFSAK